MEVDKIFRSTLLILFLIFIALYFSAQAGLIDYQAKHKTIMTEEAIKEFESDIKEGNNIDIKKYIKNKDKKFDNGLSRKTLRVSNTIGSCVDDILKFFFKKVEKAMNN